MPFRAEVGPLVLDTQIQEEVEEFIQGGRCTILAKIDSITNSEQSGQEVDLPCDCVIKVSRDDIQIDLKKEGHAIKQYSKKIEAEYPNIKIIKKTNTLFELTLNKNLVLRVHAKSNIQRDIIAVSLRSFCA